MKLDQPWREVEPTTDELRERLAVVMDKTVPRIAEQLLRQAAIADEQQLQWVRRYGKPLLSLTPGQVEAWLAALTKPLGGGQ